MEKIENKNYKILTPFKGWALQNFPFIEADFDALTNYELMCKITEYLNNIIYNQNEVQDLSVELVKGYNDLLDYVNNYFDSQDWQEMVNNKLDKMAEDGTLEDILYRYSDIINVKFYGATGDGTTDDLEAINRALTVIKTDQKLFFPTGTYKISGTIVINKKIEVIGNGTIALGGPDFNAITVTADDVVIDGLTFTNPDNYTPTTLSSGDIGDAIRIKANNCIVRNCNISNYIAGIVFGTVGGTQNKCLIENNIITNKGLNTGYINDCICSLGDNAIIRNNLLNCDNAVQSRGCIICDIGADHNIVDGNICNCNQFGSVGVHSEQSPYGIIINNNIYEPQKLGICLSTNCICKNNYVETPKTEVSGYTLDHSAISAYGNPKNLIIDSNIIYCQLGSKYGIRSNGTCDNIRITNNSFIGNNDGVDTLIWTHIANYGIIANNTSYISVKTEGIRTSSHHMNIIGNVIKDAPIGINTRENNYGIVKDNRIIKSTTGILSYDSNNIIIENNDIGNTTDTTTNGISIQNTGSAKLNIINYNIFNNVTNKYNKVSFGAKCVINDENQLTLYDTTNASYKTLTIDNGNVVIS